MEQKIQWLENSTVSIEGKEYYLLGQLGNLFPSLSHEQREYSWLAYEVKEGPKALYVLEEK